jgi:hypothetical protein
MDLARYARIGLAVSISIMVAGVLVFHGSSKAAMQAVAMVGLFTGLGAAMFMEGRERKRKAERRQ